MDSIETTVRDAIVAACQVDPSEVTPDVALDDLGLGSLGLVAVISRLEASYEREFNPDEVVSLLQTSLVGEFAAAIKSLLSREARAESATTAAVP